MKIAICGLWHVHAEGYYKTAAQFGEVVGVYEPNDAFREDFLSRNPIPVFDSMEQLLQSGADAAIVSTSSDTHADVMVRLANAGMDIFTEKVLALTTEDCLRVEEAVKRNGVRFVISFPHKFNPAVRAVKAVADSGELGKINYFRFRNVHSGSIKNWLPAHFYNAKECGGGAMIDLGAHGMYLADWFLGMPESASSTFTLACESEETAKKNIDRVEDNAVTVLRYANGCIAVNETGFVSQGCPMILEVGGELGRAYMMGNVAEKQTVETGEPVALAVGEALPFPIQRFCQGETAEGCGMEEAKNLTRLMEMAYE